MAGQDPSPQTTLLILLGASSWPLSELSSSTAFENAVRDLRAYFLSDPQGFHLPESQVLDLFNSDESGPDILNRISDFLRDHITRKKESSIDVRDIFAYFVGHGGITKDSSNFYLAIQRTRKDYEKATSIAIDDLAERLKKGARFQRRMLVLDCCFAAAAVKFLQGPASTVLKEKTIAAFEEKDQGKGFPSKGTSFLASSGKDVASVILPDETSTMFTSALLSVLRTGDPFQKRERLSLSTVHRLTIDFLSKTYGDNFPRPELHSPDQTEGKVEDVPFFPNLAIKAIETSQSREVLPIQEEFEDKKQQSSKDQTGDEEDIHYAAPRDGKAPPTSSSRGITSTGQSDYSVSPPLISASTRPRLAESGSLQSDISGSTQRIKRRKIYIVVSLPIVIILILATFFLYNTVFKVGTSTSPTPTAQSTTVSGTEPTGTFGFENGVENWIAPEGAFKLSKVDTTTERVHSGAHALRLTTVLIGNGNKAYPGQEYYTHSEATVYFDQPLPGLSKPGPYNLTGKTVSCFVYLPSTLATGNTAQAFVRMFSKDRQFANDYGPIVSIDASHVGQWFQISLIIGKGDPDKTFNPKSVWSIGVLLETIDGSTLSFNGSIYIDDCFVGHT